VTETERPTQGYRWAISADPDLLVVQLPAIAAVGGGQTHDAMKALFRRRGFEDVSRLDELVPPVARRVALARVDDDNAELVVHVGDTVGASRIPIPHHNPAWAGRVFGVGEIAVLVTDAAVAADGSMTDDLLSRDVAAGGVLAARVPAGELKADRAP